MDIRGMSTASIKEYLKKRTTEYNDEQEVVKYLLDKTLKKLHPLPKATLDIVWTHTGKGLWAVSMLHKPTSVKTTASGIKIDPYYEKVLDGYAYGYPVIDNVVEEFSQQVYTALKELTGMSIPDIIKAEKESTKRSIEAANSYSGKLYPDY